MSELGAQLGSPDFDRARAVTEEWSFLTTLRRPAWLIITTLRFCIKYDLISREGGKLKSLGNIPPSSVTHGSLEDFHENRLDC